MDLGTYSKILYDAIFNVSESIERVERDLTLKKYNNRKKINFIKNELYKISEDNDNIVYSLISFVKNEKRKQFYLETYEKSDDFDEICNLIYDLCCNLSKSERELYIADIKKNYKREMNLRKYIGKYDEFQIPKSKNSKLGTKVFAVTLTTVLSVSFVFCGSIYLIDKIVKKGDKNTSNDLKENNNAIVYDDDYKKSTTRTSKKEEMLTIDVKDESPDEKVTTSTQTTTVTTTTPVETEKVETKTTEEEFNYFVAPDGTVWVSEEDYYESITTNTTVTTEYEPVTVEEDDGFFVAPDGSIWETEEDYYEWLYYNSEDIQYSNENTESSLQLVY